MIVITFIGERIKSDSQRSRFWISLGSLVDNIDRSREESNSPKIDVGGSLFIESTEVDE